MIQIPIYSTILNGNKIITKDEFNFWHKENTLKITKTNSKINIGWATKLINVYLKTIVYVANEGRPNLIESIHPPIDGGLWEGISKNFNDKIAIINKTHHRNKIKDINSYDDYKTIINGMEMIAANEKCLLIEVEKFWKGTKHD